MFGFGMGELLLILAIALLVLGPAKIPQLATGLGKALRSFKKAASGVTERLEADPELKKPIEDLKSAVRD
jgi:TatA/E family protein of Tat protein translocase